jgi:hypothetical protein
MFLMQAFWMMGLMVLVNGHLKDQFSEESNTEDESEGSNALNPTKQKRESCDLLQQH